MSGSRIYAPSTWPASAAALVVLATLTVGWVRAPPDAAGGNGGSGTASGDLPLRNDDGTVGPIVALGDTTTDMLARFSGDVAAWSPRVVVVLGGTNDLEAGRRSGADCSPPPAGCSGSPSSCRARWPCGSCSPVSR